MPRSPSLRPRSADESTATPIELFFDLVFVFALTQVTALIAADLTAYGAMRGLLIVCLLWWSWVGFSWLSNVISVNETPVRILLFVAMGTMFALALAIPEAFDDQPGGLNGPLLVAVCYLIFRFLHLALFWISGGADKALRKQLIKFAISMIGGTGLLFVASQLDGTAQTVAWCAALASDYVGTYLGGSKGWRLRSASHFAERHALILIVALGESIVATGIGVASAPITWAIIVASCLGLSVTAALWWSYFHAMAARGEQALEEATEEYQPRLAQHAYTFLHLPLVGGVILLAVGLKKVNEYVADTSAHDLGEPLLGVALVALCAGVAMFFAGQAAFTLRTLHTLDRPRLIASAAFLAMIPIGTKLPAIMTLLAVAVLAIALVVYESRSTLESVEFGDS